jgi:flagellar assembly protein FliH
VILQEYARILKPDRTGPLQAYPLEHAAGPLSDTSSVLDQDPERVAYERGVAAGEQRMKQEIADLLERQNALLETLIREIRASREAWLKDADEPIAALALAIARKVLHEQSDLLQQAIVEQTRQALERVRGAGPVTVRVNPDDVAILQQQREALTALYEGPLPLHVEADARISRGGCLVETPERVVDARIETQLARIAEALKQKMMGLNRAA